MKTIRIFIILLASLKNIVLFALSSSALETLLHQLPEWGTFGDQVQIEKIETGLTNHNFKVVFPTKAYFVRMGSDRPDLLGIDPAREYVCAKQAADLGIAPNVLLYVPEDHTMVMPFIVSQPLQKNRLTTERILSALRQFHTCGKTLPTMFCPYGVIRDYYHHAMALRADHCVPFSSSLLPLVEEIRRAVPHFQQLVPCHLDLFSRNFLDDGNKIWIIDWEYSAMADPLYDLACWASVDSLSLAEMQELLELYLDSPAPRDLAYLYVMSILVDIRWGLWNLIQAEVSQIKANYSNYADELFNQAFNKAEHPQYQKSLLLLQEKR